MGYTINLSDGMTVLGVIDDRTLNGTLAPVLFIGRNQPNYGDALNENFAHMLENFRSTIVPDFPMRGQLWFDPSGAPTTPTPPTNFSGVVPRMKINVQPSATLPPVWWEVAHAINGTIHAPAAVIGSLSVTGGISSNGEINGTATRARYADLAERYAAHPDQDITAGCVVELGGPAEIQLSSSDATPDVFGVVSTRPGFLLNDDAGDDQTHPYVALAGRVPCRVIGPVKRGDRLVASEVPGVARARMSEDDVDSVFARSLSDNDETGVRLIEVAVGVR